MPQHWRRPPIPLTDAEAGARKADKEEEWGKKWMVIVKDEEEKKLDRWNSVIVIYISI